MTLDEYTSNLSVTRRSPTLVEYSVSSRPNTCSVGRKLLELLFLLAKICLISVNLYWWLYNDNEQTFINVFGTGLVAYRYSISWIFSFVSMALVLRRMYIRESFLVVQSFGVQVSSTGWWYIFGPTSKFIPSSDVLDILIHEAFIGFQIRYILVIIVKDQSKLQLVFKNTLPRRDVLETVLRGSRQCFYRERDVGTTKAQVEMK